MPRFSVVLLLMAALVASCGSSGAGGDDGTTTSTIAPTTSVSTSTEPPTTTVATTTTPAPAAVTTTLPPLEPPQTLFAMTESEILEASEPVMITARTIIDAVESEDLEQLVSAFVPDAYTIDFIVPSLRPPVGAWFGIFMKLCDESEATNVHVNVSGVAWEGWCSGFYEGLTEDPPPTTWFLPHVLMEQAIGTVMLNRVEAEVVAAYPAETSDAIGLPISREKAVARMAEAAGRFAPLFEQAWESGDPRAIAGLYADEGMRIDGFAGLDEDPRATHAWIEAFVRDYDEIALEIDLLAASAPGPGGAYTLTLGEGEGSCLMRMVSAWELDDDNRIQREYVYYDPDTVFGCGWEAPG